jgi:hypothetical protein
MTSADVTITLSRAAARERSMASAVRSRRATRLRRGAYVDTETWVRLRPFQRYRARVAATALMLPDPVLCLESAAAHLGLPVFGEPADIHLYAAHRAASRGYRHGTDVVHASVDAKAIVRVDGVRVTSVRDTALDLARVLPLALGVAVVDAALAAGVTREEFEASLAAQANRRGRRAATEAVRRGDARSGSVLESVSRVVIELLGYPDPELQREFRWGSGRAFADFFWPESGVVGEADGNAKYFGLRGPTEEVIRQERRREVELRRLVSGLARWEWKDAFDPPSLDAILGRSGLARARPAEPRIERALRNRRTPAP